MCGIFGYIGLREAAPLIMEGLGNLEYRGYDSSGAAVLHPSGCLQVRKAAGKLQRLASLMAAEYPPGVAGLGHTRWATHGGATDENAHPHTDSSRSVAVVHNGIVENYQALKDRLQAEGRAFASATDSEVIPNLVHHYLLEGSAFVEAVRLAAADLQGAHAIAAMYTGEPDTLVALRIGNAGGISIGYGQGEMFLASDLPALAPVGGPVASLAPGQMAVLRPAGCTYLTLSGDPIEDKPLLPAVSPLIAAKGGYAHYMLKEIMEQPETAMSALWGRLSFDPPGISFPEIPFTLEELQSFRRVIFIGMGTSYHAAQVGAYLMEKLARLPATAENASEFHYRDPVLDSSTLVVSVVQSGETADTLEAMHLAYSSSARTLTICNVEGSQATRMAEGAILMHAGPEIAVASSKTFTSSIVCLYLLALFLGRQRETLSAGQTASSLENLAHLPSLLGQTLELNQGLYPHLAAHYAPFRRFLFVGRGLLEPLAREGALKLKEISYIHAEGLPAAELKHGAIALVDPETPVVALALQDPLYPKMMNNIHEVRARQGPVLAVATHGDERIVGSADHFLWVPPCPPELAPLVTAIPLQLLRLPRCRPDRRQRRPAPQLGQDRHGGVVALNRPAGKPR